MSNTPKTSDANVLDTIASRFRRLRGDEAFDTQGIRTIWHRGPQRTELLTWESQDGSLIKQELSFAGLIVEYTPEHGIRTGIIPITDQVTDTGQPKSTVIRMQTAPDVNTLQKASTLLGLVPARDYYGQHLMEISNDWLVQNGHTPIAPVTTSGENFNRAPIEPEATWRTITGFTEERTTNTIPLPIIAIAGVILGVILGLLLF